MDESHEHAADTCHISADDVMESSCVVYHVGVRIISITSQVEMCYLIMTVSDDGQVEESTAVFFGEDGVNSCSVRSDQLSVHAQIIRWNKHRSQSYNDI